MKSSSKEKQQASEAEDSKSARKIVEGVDLSAHAEVEDEDCSGEFQNETQQKLNQEKVTTIPKVNISQTYLQPHVKSQTSLKDDKYILKKSSSGQGQRVIKNINTNSSNQKFRREGHTNQQKSQKSDIRDKFSKMLNSQNMIENESDDTNSNSKTIVHHLKQKVQAKSIVFTQSSMNDSSFSRPITSDATFQKTIKTVANANQPYTFYNQGQQQELTEFQNSSDAFHNLPKSAVGLTRQKLGSISDINPIEKDANPQKTTQNYINNRQHSISSQMNRPGTMQSWFLSSKFQNTDKSGRHLSDFQYQADSKRAPSSTVSRQFHSSGLDGMFSPISSIPRLLSGEQQYQHTQRTDGIPLSSPNRPFQSSSSSSRTGASSAFKFKRILNMNQQEFDQAQHSSQTLGKDFNNISHLINPIHKSGQSISIKSTPLLSEGEQALKEKLKTHESLNNIYLKMLEEFQVPFEQDFTKIAQKIKELELSNIEHGTGVDKDFVIDLLKNQLDTKKMDSLKKAQMRVPTNRFDVGMLKQWLDFMLLKIYQDKFLTGKEIIERTQVVFESCFLEILSQISVDCSDRGALLKKIWDNQRILFVRLLDEQQILRLNNEQECLDEITRVHKMYNQEVERLKCELKISEDSRNALQERFSILKNNVKYLKKNNKNISKLMKILKFDNDFYKKKNEDLELAMHHFKIEYGYHPSANEQINNLLTPQIQMSSSTNQANKPKKNQVSQPKRTQAKEKGLNGSKSKNKLIKISQQLDAQEAECLKTEVDKSLISLNKNPTIKINDDQSSNQSSICQFPSNYLIEVESQQLIEVPANDEKKINPVQLLQDQIVSNNKQMLFEKDEDLDSQNESFILEDKGTDMLDWKELFTKQSNDQTILMMHEIIVKSEIVQSTQGMQVDYNSFKEIGYFYFDKGVQTTELDPEYEEQMKGFGIMKLEKELDALGKAEEYYDKVLEKFNLPFEIKKALFEYLKKLNKNQDQMQTMLREEIGIKEKYHKENIELKITSKESNLRSEELSQKNYQLEEFNRQIQSENGALSRDLILLKRKTKKLTTHLVKIQHAQNDLFSETNKFADNIQRSSLFSNIVVKVASGVEPSQQDIEQIRNKVLSHRGEDDSNNLSINNSNNATNNSRKTNDFLSIFKQSPQNNNNKNNITPSLVTGNSNNPSSNNNNNNNINSSNINNSNNNGREQITSKFLKIKNVVKKLIQMDLGSLKNEDLHSSDSDNYDGDEDSKQGSQNDKRFLKESGSMTNSINLGALKLGSLKQTPFKFNDPKFERKKQQKVSSPNLSNAILVFNKVIKKIQKGNVKMPMTKKTLCKYISLIYQERSKNEQARNDPFHLSCYDYCLAHFGVKRVAENKVMQLYEAAYFFKGTSTRVNLFGQFIGLFDEYTPDELEYYISTLIKLDEESPSFLQTFGQAGEIVYCSYEKMIGVFKRLEERSTKLFIEKQLVYLQKNRVLHKQNNNYPVIDVDLVMEKVLEAYRRIKQSNKDLYSVFGAADLDNDGMIGLYEFMCLCKYVENMEEDNDKIVQAEKIFFQKCDLVNVETGERTLSVEQFVSLATQRGYFRLENIQKFGSTSINNHNGVEYKNLCSNIDELRKNKESFFQQLKMRLFRSNSFTPFFSNSINKLYKEIDNQSNSQMNWMSYKILDLESRHILLQFEIQDCLPQEFIHFISHSKDNIDEFEGDFLKIDFSINKMS